MNEQREPWIDDAEAALGAALHEQWHDVGEAVERIPPGKIPQALVLWIDVLLVAEGLDEVSRSNRGRPIRFRSAETGDTVPAPNVPPEVRRAARSVAARGGDDPDAFVVIVEESTADVEAWNDLIFGTLHVVAEGIRYVHREGKL